MNKSVFVYGGILVVALAATWMDFTGEETKERVGVVLIDGKADALEKMVYKAPDTEVVFEMKSDDVGRYAWLTVSEQKKKRVDGEEVDYTKVTSFKAGSTADKLIDSVSPVMALRDLGALEADKASSFGLEAADTTFTITTGGRSTTLTLGGETYGTKDRYVRDDASGKVYVVDDDVFKPVKFAASRLPERNLMSYKMEDIESVTLGQGGSTVTWTQKNRDDRAAAFWSRVGDVATPAAGDAASSSGGDAGKDDTFRNWFSTWAKLKSTAYVQDDENPSELKLQYEVTLRGAPKAEERVEILTSGDDWYGRSNYTRGLVKLSRGPADESASEVDDILEGRVPPAKPKPDRPNPHGGPPGMAPGGRPSMPGMVSPSGDQ